MINLFSEKISFLACTPWQEKAIKNLSLFLNSKSVRANYPNSVTNNVPCENPTTPTIVGSLIILALKLAISYEWSRWISPHL